MSGFAGMRVFVTGGSGFAGCDLVRALHESGGQGAIWLHQREPPSDIASCNVVHAETLPADCEALLKCDTVCHVAAFVRLEDPTFARQCFEASALLTLQLALAAACNSKMKFVYFSLGQGYLVPPGCPAQETDSLLSRSMRTFLIRSKLLGEIIPRTLPAALIAMAFAAYRIDMRRRHAGELRSRDFHRARAPRQATVCASRRSTFVRFRSRL
jgi:nucleoside-diphosphate-sugar epimerase